VATVADQDDRVADQLGFSEAVDRLGQRVTIERRIVHALQPCSRRVAEAVPACLFRLWIIAVTFRSPAWRAAPPGAHPNRKAGLSRSSHG